VSGAPVERRSDLVRPEPLEDRFRSVFGTELGTKAWDTWLAYQKEYREWRACADCGEAEPFMFMLRDEIWEEIGPRVSADGSTWASGFLCIWCCEIRLGRLLVVEDFTPVPVNRPILFAMGHLDLREKSPT
jgi:hypothetical protein